MSGSCENALKRVQTQQVDGLSTSTFFL